MFECRACILQGIRAITRESEPFAQNALNLRFLRSRHSQFRPRPQFRHSSTTTHVQNNSPILADALDRPTSYDTSVIVRTDRGLKRLPVNKGIHPQRYPRESPTKREWIKAPQEKQFLYRKELRGRFQTRIGGKHKKIQVTAKELEDAGDAEARVVKKLGVADQTSESDKALIKPANINEKQLQHTLKFLVDPTKLQEHTQRLLQKGDVPQAYAILQYASKSRDCVVSWNALVNWCLNEGRLNAALKIYNEMKKRAQWPDGYTYSHLLWGLSKLSHFPSALPKALSIYHSMFAENARTKPNTRHLNMVLKCCARTGDMDALWGVVSKIGNDKSGPRPDAITYVIILNAIQRGAIENVPSGATDEELAWHFDRAVLEGRRIWVEVIEKWRQLDLAMDDSLVCAIGRLMLLSWRPRDWDDILSLVQQTQNVSRQTPHWGSAVRKTLDVEMIKGRTEIYRGTPAEMKSDIDDRTRSNRGEEFDSLDGGANLIFAQPTNNTLSLILEACLKLVAKKAADKYWQLLTDAGKFALKPDNDNFNHYLRIMRMAKSSVQATLLVQDDMKNAIPETKTFRIAMSACTRNAGSQQAAAPKAVEHAAILVQIMAKRMKDPDFHTLNAYINLAADRKDPTAMIKAIHDVDGILAKRFKWNDPDAIRDMKEDVQRYFPELCSNMLDSVNWLLSSGHFSRGSKEAKAWIFTREKYSKFVRRPNKKELNSRDAEEGKAVPEKGSHRSVQSINARNIKRMLKQPSQSNDVVVRKAKIYAPPRVRKMA